MILDHGKVIAEGSPAKIIDSLGAENVIRLHVEGADVVEDVRAIEGVNEVREEIGALEITVQRTEEVLPRLVTLVRERGGSLTELTVHRPTLEDVFVSLTGRHLRDN